MIIHILTSNEGKFREISKMLQPLDHEVIKEDIPYPEVQAESLKTVVEHGIEWILENDMRPWMKAPDHGFVIDDSGLFIKALKGFPGVYSKYVFFTIGNTGILRLLEEKKDREAVFRTSLMFHTDGRNHYFEGLCRAHIAYQERGRHGFGYDPVFIPIGSELTFAEMDTAQKNTFSHRGKAMESFLEFLISMATNEG